MNWTTIGVSSLQPRMREDLIGGDARNLWGNCQPLNSLPSVFQLRFPFSSVFLTTRA